MPSKIQNADDPAMPSPCDEHVTCNPINHCYVVYNLNDERQSIGEAKINEPEHCRCSEREGESWYIIHRRQGGKRSTQRTPICVGYI